MKSIYDQLIDWEKENTDFVLLEYDRNYTLGDILHEVNAMSKSLDYISESYIGIYLTSPIDIIFLYLACIKNNKTPILFHESWSETQVDHIINKYKITHIISQWSKRKIVNNKVVIDYLEELANSSRGCGISTIPIESFHPEVVLFTSGSTGCPKGVCLDLKNFYNSVTAWNSEINFVNSDVYTLCLPLSHISGLSILYRAIYSKFSILILDSYRDLDKYKATLISLVPSVLNRIIDNKKYLKSLRLYRGIIIGGEAASIDLLQKCLEMDLNIFVSYGMTETCSGIAGYWIKDYPNELSSSGKPFSGVDFSIVNDHIQIKSKMNMRGYFMEDDLSDSFITSDLGEIKDDFLYVKGRRDEIVTSGGEKINISYVRDIILENVEIKSVVLTILKDKRWGNVVHAEIASNTKSLSVQDVKQWCESRMPNYCVPQNIRIVTK